jgi:hypothetical protein
VFLIVTVLVDNRSPGDLPLSAPVVRGSKFRRLRRGGKPIGAPFPSNLVTSVGVFCPVLHPNWIPLEGQISSEGFVSSK